MSDIDENTARIHISIPTADYNRAKEIAEADKRSFNNWVRWVISKELLAVSKRVKHH